MSYFGPPEEMNLTGSAKGPPDHNDSMFSCVASCEVSPGVIAAVAGIRQLIQRDR